MKHPLLTLEPLIWLLFGQGILLGTMLLTGWILVVGILIPMGMVDASALNYVRAHQIATASLFGFIPVGQLVLAALLVLPLWEGAHHVRSLLIDFGWGGRGGVGPGGPPAGGEVARGRPPPVPGGARGRARGGGGGGGGRGGRGGGRGGGGGGGGWGGGGEGGGGGGGVVWVPFGGVVRRGPGHFGAVAPEP